MDFVNFPKIVEFQTHSYCNSKCLYCPHPKISTKLPNEYMTDEVFFSIIEECKGKKIEKLIPYLNNEPLLDKHFIDKLVYIREKLPYVFVEISTNAVLLTEEIINSFIDLQIDEVRLSIFGLYKRTYETMMPGLDYNKVISNIKKIKSIKDKRECKTKFVVTMLDVKLIEREEIIEAIKYWQSFGLDFYLFEVNNRAGILDNKYHQFENEDSEHPMKGCKYRWPLECVNILYNGDVIFCCNDWNRKHIVGNILNSPILEIWNSNEFNILRNSLYNNDQGADLICKKCTLAY